MLTAGERTEGISAVQGVGECLHVYEDDRRRARRFGTGGIGESGCVSCSLTSSFFFEVRSLLASIYVGGILTRPLSLQCIVVTAYGRELGALTGLTFAGLRVSDGLLLPSFRAPGSRGFDPILQNHSAAPWAS